MAQKKVINIVSVQLRPEAKQELDSVCDERGMTIKSLLGRLIGWFVVLDRTEQAIVLGQVEMDDMQSLAHLVISRNANAAGGAAAAAVKKSRARAGK